MINGTTVDEIYAKLQSTIGIGTHDFNSAVKTLNHKVNALLSLMTMTLMM